MNIEFYGGPNAGKTTAASLFSSLLAVNEYTVEIPPKIPFNFLLNKHYAGIKNPFLLYFQQYQAIKNLQSNDYIIIDNPLLSELIYSKQKDITKKEKKLLEKIILTQYKQFDNLSLFIKKSNQNIKPCSLYNLEESLNMEKTIFKKVAKYTKIYQIYESHPLIGIEILYDLKEKLNLKNELILNFLKEAQYFVNKIKNKKILLSDYLYKYPLKIDIYAGPGSGKSTTARTLNGLFNAMNINSFNPIEIPKLHIWENSFNELNDQLKMFINQKYNQNLSLNNFNISIIDSPLLMQLVYLKEFPVINNKEIVMLVEKEIQKTLKNSYSIFLNRKHKFSNNGRIHNKEKSEKLNNEIKELLLHYKINFKEYDTHPFIGFEVFLDFIKETKSIKINEPVLIDFFNFCEIYIKKAKLY